MAISKKTRTALYARANGRCECAMSVCAHHRSGQRCPHGLYPGSWEAHHRWAAGSDTLGNLTALCATCHKNTRTYGRN